MQNEATNQRRKRLTKERPTKERPTKEGLDADTTE